MAQGSTRSKRKLGNFVALHLKRRSISVEDVVEGIGTSRSTMFKLFRGEHKPQKPMFIALLTLFVDPDLTDKERAEAWKLYDAADIDTADIQHEADLPKNYVAFRRDEPAAETERTLDSDILPGILQTPKYAESIARAAWRLIADETWSNKAAAERLNRSSLLTRVPHPIRVQALIHVAVLDKLVGGREVMAGQYDHLLTMGALPNVEIRAIPAEAGAYGVHNGALTLLNFPEPDDEPLSAYIDSPVGLVKVKELRQVQTLSDVWDDVARIALTAEGTAGYIREIKDKLK